MFYAVRTVLAHIDPALAKARTRGTIIARFHKHVIMGMSLDRKHGRSIQDAEDLRLLADYDDLALDPDVVAGIVERAEQFVAAIALLLESPSS